MNKQEAINELMSKSREIIFGDDENVYLSRKRTIELISQIHEPEKVTVPKFVADWVDNSREYSFDFDEWFDYENQPLKVYNWLNPENKRQAELNALALVTLIVNGANAVEIEIEQEKLYTVEIPNPNSAGGKLVLFKQQSTGRLILDMLNPNINKPKYLHLTEAEIKKELAWTWHCATRVDRRST